MAPDLSRYVNEDGSIKNPNPCKGRGRRTGPAPSHRNMSLADINEMFAANGIEWSDHEDDASLGIAGGYTDEQINQRIADGVYDEMDTPEVILKRVRRKMAESTSKADELIGQEIIDILAFEGMGALEAGHIAWIPEPDDYVSSRTALEEKITPKLKEIAKTVPQEIADRIDDDFHFLLDSGGKGDKPTERTSLLKRLVAWLKGEKQPEPERIELTLPEREKVKV